jgi:hypothetical protein
MSEFTDVTITRASLTWIDAIEREREYQDATSAKWNHKGKPTIGEELLMMEEYLAKARETWCSSSDKTATLGVLRKVAGIAARCFENHGVPLRGSMVGPE